MAKSKFYWRRCPKRIAFNKSFRFNLVFVPENPDGWKHMVVYTDKITRCPTCKGTGRVKVKGRKKK